MKSETIGALTSSPASAAGPMRSGSPAGRMTGPSGPEAALASLSARPESAAAPGTNDISGPLFTASSPSFDLQRSLENRLRAVLDGCGSPLFDLTWSAWDMPSGPPICRLRASAPRISGSACSGSPTPKASDGSGGRTTKTAGGGNAHLDVATRIAGWATPSARDWKDSPGMAAEGTNPDGTVRSRTDQLPRQTHGTALNGSPAPTGRPGQLNPGFTRWLMGFPVAWEDCADMATLSSRKPRRRS